MQTRFTPCNTILYAYKHVLHRCSKRFGGQYELLRLATNDSGVNMSCCALQQTIRWAERAFLKGLRVGKDHFHVFGTHAVQQSAHLLLGILLCELQVLA